MINFKDYNIDHIYCINYLPDNQLNHMKNEFDFIGIDYNDNRIFSWEFDFDNNIQYWHYDEILKSLSLRYEYIKNQYGFFDNKLLNKTVKLCLRNYSIFKKHMH